MNKQENLSLQLAFTGEEKRDASASIRGFVYQNLLAIEELIKEDTDRVFCEYIEDIGIDNGDWKKTEVCTECIFNKKCIRGKV